MYIKIRVAPNGILYPLMEYQGTLQTFETQEQAINDKQQVYDGDDWRVISIEE